MDIRNFRVIGQQDFWEMDKQFKFQVIICDCYMCGRKNFFDVSRIGPLPRNKSISIACKICTGVIVRFIIHDS